MLNIKAMGINAKREVNKNLWWQNEADTRRNHELLAIRIVIFIHLDVVVCYNNYWRKPKIEANNFLNHHSNVKWLNEHQIIIINIKIIPIISSLITPFAHQNYTALKIPLFCACVLYGIFMCGRRNFSSIFCCCCSHLYLRGWKRPKKKKMIVH